jgi:ribosome-binding protein aMBF1 (putative translation factor)
MQDTVYTAAAAERKAWTLVLDAINQAREVDGLLPGTRRVLDADARAAAHHIKDADWRTEHASRKAFGERLRSLRVASGWTQREVAARVGVHRALVGRWERAGDPVPEHHKPALASLFGLQLDSIDLAWSRRDVAEES